MTLSKLILSFILVCMSATVAQTAAFAQCPASPEAAALIRRYSGEYENFAYGFKVSIPSPFVGRDVDNPLYQRGFTLLFPDSQESITVYADVNSLDWRNVREAAAGYTKAFTDQATEVFSETRTQSQLGHQNAIEDAAEYSCGESQSAFASITVVSLSPDKRFIYTLRWEGKRNKRDEGRKVLGQLVSSWKFFTPRS
jgi:hypothetical protein